MSPNIRGFMCYQFQQWNAVRVKYLGTRVVLCRQWVLQKKISTQGLLDIRDPNSLKIFKTCCFDSCKAQKNHLGVKSQCSSGWALRLPTVWTWSGFIGWGGRYCVKVDDELSRWGSRWVQRGIGHLFRQKQPCHGIPPPQEAFGIQVVRTEKSRNGQNIKWSECKMVKT